ncbi:MAG: hypothetical protein IJU76_12245 [Desulfovibrionaceae bacterium]|nr:hypothetical protein [Desulfovibrionaceae bacterium]
MRPFSRTPSLPAGQVVKRALFMALFVCALILLASCGGVQVTARGEATTAIGVGRGL